MKKTKQSGRTCNNLLKTITCTIELRTEVVEEEEDVGAELTAKGPRE